MTDIGKREDLLLEAISALVHKRDDTLKQMDLWREAEPETAEMMNDLELHLR